MASVPDHPDPAASREAILGAGLLSREALADRCRALQQAGRKIVFTNGCFDLLHPGHLLYLREARALGDCLVVGLNTDESVRALKGSPRPYQREADRALMLLCLRSVDYVSLFPEPTPLELIEAVLPDILVKGGDYRPEQVAGREVVVARGGTVRIMPFHPGYSSSRLIRRIREDSLSGD